MALGFGIEPYELIFRFDAGTSRGILKTKQTYLLKVWDRNQPEEVGVGEAGPLPGLSPDAQPEFPNWLTEVCQQLEGHPVPGSTNQIHSLVNTVSGTRPALRFALETALLDLLRGGKGVLYENDFSRGKSSIPVNGLIWMGSTEFMRTQIDEKIASGFTCIKMKIGSLDFEEECRLLHYIRHKYPSNLVLRVDANGAFDLSDIKVKLRELANYDLHSIEQPIAAGHINDMAALCRDSPLPVALDEELIGTVEISQKRDLLEAIKPQYIILKPTLLGGLASTSEWISWASSLGIGWWITSALESNVGLNALAQYTSSLAFQGHQGLGTGQLYSNNLPSPLAISAGQLHYRSLGN